MDINKLKIEKKLGSGMAGAVFLVSSTVKNEKKEYALKIEKIAEKYINKDLKLRDWREIDFSINFANKYPEQFIYLYNYDIIKNCKHIQQNEEPNYIEHLKKIPLESQKYFIEKNKSNYCIRKIYSLVNNNLYNIFENLTKKQLYSMIAQISYILYLMKQNGYMHNDLHTQNIGVKKTNKKYLTLLDNKIPIIDYQYKAIDFGWVLHKKYKLTKNEKERFENSKKNEITRLLKILASIEKNDKIKKLIDLEDNPILLKKFIKSDDYYLVKDYGINDIDRFFIYQILYPENAQKMILGKDYTVTYKINFRCDLADILYFFNNKLDLSKIIKYCAVLLNK
jgi:tRNA A-37 threonylcarbamoyl transferase component Bud32